MPLPLGTASFLPWFPRLAASSPLWPCWPGSRHLSRLPERLPLPSPRAWGPYEAPPWL